MPKEPLFWCFEIFSHFLFFTFLFDSFTVRTGGLLLLRTCWPKFCLPVLICRLFFNKARDYRPNNRTKFVGVVYGRHYAKFFIVIFCQGKPKFCLSICFFFMIQVCTDFLKFLVSAVSRIFLGKPIVCLVCLFISLNFFLIFYGHTIFDSNVSIYDVLLLINFTQKNGLVNCLIKKETLGKSTGRFFGLIFWTTKPVYRLQNVVNTARLVFKVCVRYFTFFSPNDSP